MTSWKVKLIYVQLLLFLKFNARDDKMMFRFSINNNYTLHNNSRSNIEAPCASKKGEKFNLNSMMWHLRRAYVFFIFEHLRYNILMMTEILTHMRCIEKAICAPCLKRRLIDSSNFFPFSTLQLISYYSCIPQRAICWDKFTKNTADCSLHPMRVNTIEYANGTLKILDTQRLRLYDAYREKNDKNVLTDKMW